MNNVANHKFYTGISRNLLATGQYRDLAIRYLNVMRRRKVLRYGVKQAESLARDENPLAEISFTPPLSVAGPVSSPCRLRARAMDRVGVPLALELGPHGIHRGTSVGDVIDQLRHHTGKEYSDLEVLNLYQALMSGHPKLLNWHPLKRFRVIPAMLKRLNQERDELECRLYQALISIDGRIFAVAVQGESLRAVLDQCEGGVVVGYAGTGSSARINGTEVETVWGAGKGLVVVEANDLRSLLAEDEPVIGIETNLNHWQGWTDLKSAVLRAPTARQFKYSGDCD